mgnify:FL=1
MKKLDLGAHKNIRMQKGCDSMKANSQIKGAVHSMESFGSVDGPGVRFVIFLQGCRMRCQFCHNPDTWSTNSENMVTSDDLLERALRYRSYWGKDGGITVSGGEPLLQIDFLIDFFQKAKKAGIHTVLDTAGSVFNRNETFLKKFDTLMAVTDLILLDIKEIDDERHKVLTGCSNHSILDMAGYLSEIGKPVWIRHVLVPERNDYDEDLIQLDQFVASLKNVKRLEVLPYHTMGIYKWEELGIPYKLKGIDPPSEERIENANALLHTESYIGYLDK